MFGAWGRFVYRWRWLVLLGSLALVVASVVALTLLSAALTTSDSGDNRTESWQAADLIGKELPAQQDSSFTLIFTPRDAGAGATDPAVTGAVARALAPLRDDPRVAKINESPQFISRDGRRSFVIVTMRDKFEEASKQYDAVRGKVVSDSLAIIATGNLPVNQDFTAVSEADLRRAEIVGLPLALLVLIVVFAGVLWRSLRSSSLSALGLTLALTVGALAVALVPILAGAFTILGGLAGIYALAQRRDMSVYALNVASMVGLGLAIDYSLFILSRFLEEVAEEVAEEVPRQPVGRAIERTVATTGKAIAYSGLTVAIGVAGLLFYHSSMLNSIGLAALLVVVAAVVYGLTFLPALLAVAGNGIVATGALWARRRAAQVPGATAPPRGAPPDGGFWRLLAKGVMRRPWLTLLPLLVLLLLAGTPFLRLRVGLTDPTVLPGRIESRQGFELLIQEFPAAENTEIAIVVDYRGGQPLTAERVAKLYDYSRWLGTIPGVARVQSPVDLPGPGGKPLTREQVGEVYAAPPDALSPEIQDLLRQSVGEQIVVLRVLTPLAVNSDAARDLVRRIRAGGGPDPGGAVLVGGRPAYIIDLTRSLRADTGPAAAFIMLATYLVLFLLLGSVLLPLKAVAMNLLSITASYGALVWIFQDGHLSDRLGFTPGPIDPMVPVLMFCLLFGLSMDYEVLLLSRMKEEHDRSGDNGFAVAEGLEQTGRLITGAAAIMVSVFAAFALADMVVVKSIGLGMAIAVAVDALVVRTLVVPATMRLLGELNWWAPAPLDRLYHRLGLGHEGSGGPVLAPLAVATTMPASGPAPQPPCTPAPVPPLAGATPVVADRAAARQPQSRGVVATGQLRATGGSVGVEVIPLPKTRPFRIGRNRRAQLWLFDPRISRHHAQIDYDPWTHAFVITDLASTNGVYVNGERIAVPTPLRDGDQVEIGTTGTATFAVSLQLRAQSTPAGEPGPGR